MKSGTPSGAVIINHPVRWSSLPLRPPATVVATLRVAGYCFLTHRGRRISIRFHPKRLASNDQLPGPRSASATPRLASKTLTHGSPLCEKASTDSMIATITPATAVHDPNRRSKPITAAITCGAVVCTGAWWWSCTKRKISAAATTALSSKRPRLGSPSANEDKRRRIAGRLRLTKTSHKLEMVLIYALSGGGYVLTPSPFGRGSG